MRRQLLTAVAMFVLITVVTGIVYPLVTTGISEAFISHQANGSLVRQGGRVVGSSLLAQGFTDKAGNPLPQYFQPRPSETGTSPYNGLASGSNNYGPSNPLLIGFVPGVNTVGLNGRPSKTNPFATPADPFCVPVDTTKAQSPVTSPTPGQKYSKNPNGTYICDPNTVPERAIAYRTFNGMAPNAPVPVDAVTVSFSGLDPEISIANADLQAPRVARARHLALPTVLGLVKRNIDGRSLGILGDPGVNVLTLNLALNHLQHG